MGVVDVEEDALFDVGGRVERAFVPLVMFLFNNVVDCDAEASADAGEDERGNHDEPGPESRHFLGAVMVGWAARRVGWWLGWKIGMEKIMGGCGGRGFICVRKWSCAGMTST